MLVLGKHSDDKGTQLENLTKTLLEAKQYRNVCKNSIGPGGQEIDVRGEYLVPTLKEPRTFKVICECKAYKSPVDLPHWLKFYGKLCVERQTQSQDTQGCFIALSDVNGHVRNNYDELKKRDTNVELITGDDLLDLIRQVYPMSPLKLIIQGIKVLTDRVYRGSEVLYYDGAVYWLLLFEREAYTVLKGDGKMLAPDEVAALKPMVEEAVSANTYINLQDEAHAKTRALMSETAIIMALMLGDGKGSVTLTAGQQADLTSQELETAAERLLKRRVIDGDAKAELRLPDDDYRRIADVYRTLLWVVIPMNVVGCKWYDWHINAQLIEEIKAIQQGLPLMPDDHETTMKILRLSPTALGYSLQPIAVIVEHRKDGQGAIIPPAMQQMDRDYFLKQICDRLQSDLTYPSPIVTKHFYEVRDIRELDSTGACIVKSKTEVVVKHDYRQRHLIVPFEPLKGHPVLTLGRNDLPEPWEGYHLPPALAAAPTEKVTGDAGDSASTEVGIILSQIQDTPGVSIKVVSSIEECAKKLGLNVPDGVCFLPRGFFSADAASELVHESTTQDVGVILRTAGITLEKIAPDGVTIPFQAQHDANWLGPTIFFGVAAWSQNPGLVSLALSVIANYVTDFFKGKLGKPEMSLSIVIEQGDKKGSVRITYDGPVEGFKACEKHIKGAMK